MNEIIWHDISEEPKDTRKILWFMTDSKRKIRAWYYEEAKLMGDYKYWCEPVYPNF